MTKLTRVAFAMFAGLTLSVMTGALTAVSAGDKVSAGTFAGESNHKTSGGVHVAKSGSGYMLVLEDSFFHDGAPDPKLGFGKNGFDHGTIIGPLKSNTGSQTYEIPADIDPTQFNEVWVWCQQYDVPLGKAALQ